MKFSFFTAKILLKNWCQYWTDFHFLTVVHLAYINTPFVNLEWVYRDGSQYFLTGNENLLESYFLNKQIHSLTLFY